MSITLVEEKTSKSIFRRIGVRLSKHFVTAGENTSEEANEYLGMTTIADGNSNISYVMRTQYAKKMTKDNPIIEVIWNYGGENKCQQVYIKLINPKKATMLEMFALCSFADAVGIYKEDTGSFQKLKCYAYNAAMNGRCKEITNYNDFSNRKLDWDDIINYMKDVYLDAEIYNQYQQCLKLMDMFDYVLMLRSEAEWLEEVFCIEHSGKYASYSKS